MAERLIQTASDFPRGDYAEYIGRIAMMWSAVENGLKFSIWAVADVAPALGACMTAQIYTTQGLWSALLSLLKLRKAPRFLIDRANQLSEASRGPLDLRNRIIHDHWVWRPDGSAIGRLEIAAPKKLKFDIDEVSLDELKTTLETIKTHNLAVRALRVAIYDALPSLPKMSPEELRPLNDDPR